MTELYSSIKLPNGNLAQKAMYHKQEIELYDGNPLIEALPPILSYEEAFDRLSYEPKYNPLERQLSPHHRYHALMNLTRFFQPVRAHLDLQDRFSRFVRHGYVGRNPMSKNHTEILNEFHHSLQGGKELITSPDIRTFASSFTLMGFSGIGKTTAIERILSLYPQLVVHENPINLIQIVYLKLNCPHDGSLKSLCMDFFLKIDNLLGTNYYEKYGTRRNSISSMITRMGQIARLHCIGALIIDEIQHLLTSKDNGSEKMMNFFVTLVNEIGIPVMMIGTMKARAVLQRDFRQARRGSGQGDMVWQQMEKGEDWDIFIESMWEYQWTKNFTELTQELNDTIYEESQGITDIAVKLFALSQGRAIHTGVEKITPKLITKVAKEELQLVQPMLNALRSGLISEIEKYEDIIPMDIEDYLRQQMPKVDLKAKIQAKKEEHAKRRKTHEFSLLVEVIGSLVSLGYEEVKAEKTVLQVLKTMVEPTKKEVLIQALEELDEKKPTVINKKTTPKKSESHLTKLVEKGKKKKESAYETLLQNDYIKNPLTELVI
ncbi:ATP-binding protein [Rossellomorea oryzaecorticis]|uniref:ATP-binding protein n=1 Tax=Rossellomorea oryzaecorticis TaxID=1396505 RepID=A0ABW8VVX3_9BACI